MTVEEAGGPRDARPHASERVRAEVWGVLDQALVSSVNFLTIILVARALAPADFGYFVLAFALLQSAGTLQGALITRPHNVLGAVRRAQEYADYSTTAAAAQLALTCGLAAVAAAGAGIAYEAGFSQALLFLALVPALVGWQLQELGRRMLYTERRLAAAFANDLLSYGAQAAALFALWQFDRLTGARALLTLAAAFAVGAAVVAWQLRPTLSGRLDASSLSANWRFGKWLGVAEVGQWFSTHFYIYLGAAVVGPVASAALKAGQTLLGPISVFLTFVTSYLPIVFARELQATGSIAGKTRRSLAAILPVVVPYCLLMALFATPVLEFVYGPEYGSYADVVQLFALYYVLLTFSTVAIAALSAREMTRDVFVGQAAGAALSVAIGWLLLQEWGPAGGVVGMLLSWLLAMVLLLRALRAAPENRGMPGRSVPAHVDPVDEL
jgi:O-antigen/teichoic acid export membrane protein